MDPKKRELNPELKQIYERVMNTQVKTSSPPQTANTQTAPGRAPQPNVEEITPRSSSTPSILQAPQAPAGPSITTQEPTQAQAPGNAAPSSPVSPRPVTEPTSFVFKGGQAKEGIKVQGTKTKKGISGKVIAAFVVMLLIAWGVVWAKYFGLF